MAEQIMKAAHSLRNRVRLYLCCTRNRGEEWEEYFSSPKISLYENLLR